MARAIEVPVVAKRGTLAKSIEGEAAAAFRSLGRSSGAVAPLGRMLGRIRADADEFTKSIEASNARVIAFGASVGVINGISNAFKSLVATTISVEKKLTDINIVLGASQKGIAKFGDGLFKVAKNTAQSFDVVAEAATEFARQGLSIEETLKRTNDALILTRLTGLKAADSVKGLTAAVNGFGKAGLTTTQIINKLSAVDVQFAVGTDDLIDALSRAGAVAQDAGVSFDELVALVTVAQQRTARGGAVIGNAFKTIYTRIQDPKALAALRQVGIAVDDITGAALPANRVLQNLAQSYDTLNRTQKATIDQFVAGKFQINILKSVLGDLNTVNNEYSRAQQVSANATDQAIQKNQQLNKTLAALATQGGLAVEELAKKIGDISLGPGMRNILTTFNELVEGATRGLDGEGAGSNFAKGLLRGIGGVLTGPGLIVIGGVFIKLFKDLTIFGVKSLKNLLGLNNASKQQAALQQGIGQLLATNVKFQQQIAAAEGNTARQAAIVNRFLAQEVVLREKAAAASARMAAGAYAGGFGVSTAGFITKGRGRRGAPSFAPTEVPNFGLRAFNPRVTKAGGTGPGSRPFQFTSASMLGTSENYRGTFNLNASRAALAKELPAGLADIVKNSTMSGFQMQTKMAGFTPSQQKEMIEQMRNAVSTVPGLSDRAKEALTNAHTKKTSLLEVNAEISSALKSRKITPKERGAYDQHMSEKVTERSFNSAFGTVGTGGRQGADYAIDAIRYRSGRTDPMELKKLAGFTTGDATTIASAIKKQLVSGTNPALRNRLREEARMQGKSEKFEQAMLERFAQEYRAYAINNPGGLIRGEKSYFTQLSRDQVKKRNLANLSPEEKQHIQDEVLRYNRQVLNFAPIGDAIKREKHQVGGLLGINPSQVKTKVVQNTALRSPFNPGGFGVISPTIGQNSFADARRMHRGEDLRTANLPNFALRRSGTVIPKAGSMPDLDEIVDSIMATGKVVKTTPMGYGSGPFEVSVKSIEDKASKKLGDSVGTATVKAVERSSGGRGAFGRTAGTPAPAVDPRSFTKRMRDRAGAAFTGTKAAGGAAIGPALTGMFLAEMARGFMPGATDEEALMMTPEQRANQGRLGGALAGGIYGATAGAGVSSALKAIGKKGLGPIGYVASTIGGALLGGQRNQAGLTPAQLSLGAQQQDQQAQADIDKIQKIRSGMQGMSQMSAVDQTEAARRMATLAREIQNPEAKAQILDLLQPADGGKPMDIMPALDRSVTTVMETSASKSAKLRARGGIGRAGDVGFSDKSATRTASDLVAAGITTADLEALQALGAKAQGGGILGTKFNLQNFLESIGGKAFQEKFFPNAKSPAETTASVDGIGKKLDLAPGEVADFALSLRAIGDEGFEKLIESFGKVSNKTDALVDAIQGVAQQGANVQVEFDAIRDNLLQRSRDAQVSAATFGINQRTAALTEDARINVMSRVGGTRSTIGMRSSIERGRLGRQSAQDRGQLAATAGANLPVLRQQTAGANLAFMRDIESRLTDENFDARGLSDMIEKARMEEGFQGNQLQIDKEEFRALSNWAQSLRNSVKILDESTAAQYNYIQAQEDTAKMLDSKGILIAGIEGFKNSLQSALQSIADPSMSGSKIGMNLLMGTLGAINQQASANVADFVGGKLGKFFGLSDPKKKAQRGMYISGSRTGDKNPAMLEDGEYVLNRNAVKAMGGPASLDSINFGMFPRFQNGGVFGGVSSKHRRKALDKFGHGSFGPSGGGSALGGGGIGLNLGIFNSNLSSIAMQDPTLQATRGFLRQERQKDIQKQFQKQAERDQLVQTIVGTAINFGLSKAVDKVSVAVKEDFFTPDQSLIDTAAGYGHGNQSVGPHGSIGNANFGKGRGSTHSGRGGGRHTPHGNRGSGGYSSSPATVFQPNVEPIPSGPDGVMRQLQPRAKQPTKQEIERAKTLRSVADRLLLTGDDKLSGGKAMEPLFPSGRAGKGMQTIMGKIRKITGKEQPSRTDMADYFRNLANQLNPAPTGSSTGAQLGQGMKALKNVFMKLMNEAAKQGAVLPMPPIEQRGRGGTGIIERQRGGSIDNVPAMLTGGEFVVNAGAVRKYGSNTLNSMNRFQSGGMVGNQKFVPQEGSAKSSDASSSTNNNTVNIAVNMGAAGPTISEDASGTNNDRQSNGRDLGRKIRRAVLEVIEHEKRVGGNLRDPYAKA